MSFDLEDQTVVVTGAARGIGKAIAHHLCALGSRVSGWDIGPAPIAADPAFANAGAIGPARPMWDDTPEDWNRVLATDLTGGRATY